MTIIEQLKQNEKLIYILIFLIGSVVAVWTIESTKQSYRLKQVAEAEHAPDKHLCPLCNMCYEIVEDPNE